MKELSYFFVLAVILNSCGKSANRENAGSHNKPVVFAAGLNNTIKEVFEKRGMNGCFILYDLGKDSSVVYNEARSKQAFLPASTFKIPNSLIALECEVLKDENEIIAWDGVERAVPAWNRDHTMRSGIKHSVVWFYQEIARRIGMERMQQWVDRIAYGNLKIGKEIDNFWLVGDLRITPKGQLVFLKKLVTGDLPFKKKHIETVKEILIEDQNDRYVFRAKTGWADYGQPVGWYVGYIEIDGEVFIFVNNIDIYSNEDAAQRKVIVKEVFDKVFQIELKI